MQFLNVSKVLYPHDVKLQLYQVHAVTEGTDAQATVSVRIEEEWQRLLLAKLQIQIHWLLQQMLI